MNDIAQQKYNAPALDKGLDILEFLSEQGIACSQAEIGQGINRSPSEIYRMLICLEERDYIIRNVNSGKYRLSLKMYNLSHIHSPFDELKKVAQYPMQLLSETTKQSCHLSVIYQDKLMVINQMRSPGAVSLSIQEGVLFPLSLTSSGKVLLSMLSDEERKRVLAQDVHYPGMTKKRQKEIDLMILDTAFKGYNYSNSDLTQGVSDFAFPIGSNDSSLIAALAVSSLSSIMKEDARVDDILEAIRLAQKSINKALGII